VPEPVSPDIRFELGYRPALDGVRAVAVIAVMAFHAGINHAYGGYYGVDVFFVLSGFLITSLLVAEFDHHRAIKLSRFYIRRARRLLPAVLMVLAFVACYRLVYPGDIASRGVGRDLFATLFYVANWVTLAHQKTFTGVNMLSHTWSLSIEEQFYLCWPLILFLMLRSRLSRRAIAAITLLGFLASCVERVVLLHRAGHVTPWMSFGTDARGGTLLAGCFLGLVVSWGMVPAWVRRLAVPGLFAGLAFYAYAFISTRYAYAVPHRAYTEGLPLIALASVAVIYGVVTAPDNLATRALALPPVVWIGKVSYGLYLWHLPIDRIIRPGNHDLGLSIWPLQLLRLAITLVIVTASFYLIEQPIRHGAWPWQRRVSPAPRR